MRRLLELSRTDVPFPADYAYMGIRPLEHLRTFQALLPMVGGNEGGTAMLEAARSAGHCAIDALEMSTAYEAETVCRLFISTIERGQNAYSAAQREADIVAFDTLYGGSHVIYGRDTGFVLQLWRDQFVSAYEKDMNFDDYGPLWATPLPSWWPPDALRAAFSMAAPLCLFSYCSSGDDEELADRLYRDIAMHGFQCWKWNRQPRLGKRMIDSFQECLDLGGVVLFLASGRALTRPAVLEELEVAVRVEQGIARKARNLKAPIGGDRVPIIHAARIDEDLFTWEHPLRSRFDGAYVEDLREWRSGTGYQQALSRLASGLRESWNELRGIRHAIDYQRSVARRHRRPSP